jgi:hypothetical protein
LFSDTTAQLKPQLEPAYHSSEYQPASVQVQSLVTKETQPNFTETEIQPSPTAAVQIEHEIEGPGTNAEKGADTTTGDQLGNGTLEDENQSEKLLGLDNSSNDGVAPNLPGTYVNTRIKSHWDMKTDPPLATLLNTHQRPIPIRNHHMCHHVHQSSYH